MEPDYNEKEVFIDEYAAKHFICPITLELMVDPVVAADGFTYERKAMENWLKCHTPVRGINSPMTNQRLKHRILTPNTLIQNMIKEFKSEKGTYLATRFKIEANTIASLTLNNLEERTKTHTDKYKAILHWKDNSNNTTDVSMWLDGRAIRQLHILISHHRNTVSSKFVEAKSYQLIKERITTLIQNVQVNPICHVDTQALEANVLTFFCYLQYMDVNESSTGTIQSQT